jgi:DNA polymerase III delta prime subunit
MATEDFTSHRIMLINGLEKLNASRNELQAKINNANLDNRSDISILSQIDTWEQKTIQKVQQAADEVRKEVLVLIKSKQEEIKNQFQTLSKELDNLQETKSILEQDLTRLEREIARINEDLKQSSQLPTVKLMTNQSEQIEWIHMMYVEQKSENTTSQQDQQSTSLGEYLNRFFKKS